MKWHNCNMPTFTQLHDWNLSPREAVALQNELRNRVLVTPPKRPIETIAGADISFNKFSATIYVAVVVLRLPDLEVVEEATVIGEAQFPYVPGLLSFRELPAVLEAWQKLSVEPDCVMFDGQGLAHPRRFGIACHAGLWMNRPTLGCAKSVLVGKYDEPNLERGSWTPMIHKGETVGAALRTKNKTKPIYVSVGSEMDLDSAIELTLRCDGGYRQPEPTRQAHLRVNELRLGHGK